MLTVEPQACHREQRHSVKGAPIFNPYLQHRPTDQERVQEIAGFLKDAASEIRHADGAFICQDRKRSHRSLVCGHASPVPKVITSISPSLRFENRNLVERINGLAASISLICVDGSFHQHNVATMALCQIGMLTEGQATAIRITPIGIV